VTSFPHLQHLIETMAILRGTDGCEWDREQTHESLVKYLIEEAHELVDAIESGNRVEMREEIGDVLYQLLFHADIARADPDDPFDIDEIARITNEKMRRRHPHVFGDVAVDGVDEIKANWQQLKAQEKADRTSVLDGVPSSLQGVARAKAVIERAARIQHSPDAVIEPDFTREDELGRYLLALVKNATDRGLDADRALREATRAFEKSVRESETPQAG
jgi:XTP/dITP diphosphohydrolase